MAVLLVACDAHRDFPDTAMKPCHILCTDGNVMSYADYEKSGKQAIAVVFHINQREDVEGNGYAVYLWEIAPESFADSIGVAQGTSADLTAYDGNTNTFALYGTTDTFSPLAEKVFDIWRYGQSAYIPSVAQMRLLYAAKAVVNPIIEKCGETHCRMRPMTVGMDIDRSERTTDSQGMALLFRKWSHAGNAKDTGA